MAKRRPETRPAVTGNGRVDENRKDVTLLPGLPNHLAQLCLSKLHPSVLHPVCVSWRRFIYSRDFPPFFSLYALLFKYESNETCAGDQCRPCSIAFSCFDPVSGKWRPLPSPPSDPPICLIRRHPSFISRVYSIQSVGASGRLVLIAGNTHEFLPALARPLVFDPLSGKWCFGPPFSSPRRWCVAGSMRSEVYVASGTSSQYNIDVARSVERWDMSRPEGEWRWERRAPFRDGRFSREAAEAIGYRGKLFMVNVRGESVKEGAAYDVVNNRWEEMPPGMLKGWNGPAAVDKNAMYVVDRESGSLQKYDDEKDCWERLTEPSDELKGAEHVSAGCGKVCVASGGGRFIAIVDVLARPANVRVVNPPEGMEVVAVHVLPRMIDPPSDFLQ
ncbi:F-box/kelch-repeat protein SKIP25-like [Andrographis paniculata]|uniref:F-box/kelch-repeat protein SKIP25-like n=1 Tax=Andrographis paniculata TaxID=175694 RepID=UPI0021E77C7E|nr:F-box/kelch-repeat protein SKIP25-like [Andrographis paniculata]